MGRLELAAQVLHNVGRAHHPPSFCIMPPIPPKRGADFQRVAPPLLAAPPATWRPPHGWT